MRNIYDRLRAKKKDGFTIIELVIALVISSMVIGIAVVVVQLLSRGVGTATNNAVVVQDDAAFVMTLNDSISKSTTSFTVPKNSFRLNNLTPGWNYIGMIYDVTVPAAASRTGREIKNVNALIYAEYQKNPKQDSDVPPNCIQVSSNDPTNTGSFLIRYLGHTYSDTYGNKYDYRLEFKPVNAAGGGQTNRVSYDFKSMAIDDNGNPLSGSEDAGLSANISNMLASLNAIQVTYRGTSGTNPATALAFRSDFVPTTYTENNPNAANVITMILDYSGSMTRSISPTDSTSRFTSLSKNVTSLLEKLSAKRNTHVILVPFGITARSPQIQYGSGRSSETGKYFTYSNTGKHIFDLANDSDEAKNFFKYVNPRGETNVPDGIRIAYYDMKKYTEELKKKGYENVNHMVIVLTDGEMNALPLTSYYMDYRKTKSVNFKESNGTVTRTVYNATATTIPTGDELAKYALQYVGNAGGDVGHVAITRDTNTYGGWYVYNTSSDIVYTEQKLYDETKKWAGKIRDEFKANTYLTFISQKIENPDGSYTLPSVPDGDRDALQKGFGTEKEFVIDDESAFDEVFAGITVDMEDVMFAFQGPDM